MLLSHEFFNNIDKIKVQSRERETCDKKWWDHFLECQGAVICTGWEHSVSVCKTVRLDSHSSISQCAMNIGTLQHCLLSWLNNYITILSIKVFLFFRNKKQICQISLTNSLDSKLLSVWPNALQVNEQNCIYFPVTRWPLFCLWNSVCVSYKHHASIHFLKGQGPEYKMWIHGKMWNWLGSAVLLTEAYTSVQGLRSLCAPEECPKNQQGIPPSSSVAEHIFSGIRILR